MHDTKLDDKKLKDFLKALKGPMPKAKVGILEKLNGRTDGLQNAEIGIRHEFGVFSKGIPQRSFLRMPIMLKLGEKLAGFGFYSESFWKQVISMKSLTPIFKKIGDVGENIVKEAFMTKGYGKWKPLSPVTVASKSRHPDMILIESEQLRNSIGSAVSYDS